MNGEIFNFSAGIPISLAMYEQFSISVSQRTANRKKFVEEFQLADDTLSDERKTKRMDCSGCQLSVKWNQCSESGGLKEISG